MTTPIPTPASTPAPPPAHTPRPAPVVSIDWTRCDGHGLCTALLPDSIRRDDWGYPVLDQDALSRERRGDLRRAVGACPALALRLGG